MSRYDRRQDRASSPDDLVFNALLTHALYDYLERQGRMLEELCADEAGQAPVEVRKKADGSYQKGRLARTAITLLVTGILVFTTAFNTVEAFRVNILNVCFQATENINELIVNAQTNIPRAAGSKDTLLIEYLPKGFTVEGSQPVDSVTTIKYVRGLDWVQFQQYPLTSISYHEPGLDSDEFNIYINDYPGHISTVDSETYLFWYPEGYILMVSSNLDTDEVIRIAKSVYPN